MENRLKKIAKELQSYDEASLLQLWEKYHDIVKRFEPTKKWEESVLILSIIQSVHWKNQLFNLKWADSKKGWPHTHKKTPAGKKEAGGKAFEPEEKKRKGAGKVIEFTNKNKNRDGKNG
ncbi:MAG: hypothetical protein K9K64_01145 [Desulfohalobiaceae bacterium]|nr:hypothetical protein [Desulfohalobiaceae bacterium]